MEADSSKSGDVPFLGDVVEPVPSAAPPAAPRPQGYYRTLVLLCMVGFFWNCKPSEPYLTRYLLTDKNLTEAQLDHEVWPWYTYGKFLFLLPVGIIAESLGYRFTIFVGILCRESTRVMLIFSEGTAWMGLMEVAFATATAVDIIYFAYVYMLVDKHLFQEATGYIHAAYHVGNLLGSLCGEALVSFTPLGDHLVVLFYISWAMSTVAALFALAMPKPKFAPPPSLAQAFRESGCRKALVELGGLYRDVGVRQWSVWWVLAVTPMILVGNYHQTQFYTRDPNANFGLIEALMELAFAGASMLPCLCEGFIMRHGVHVVWAPAGAIAALLVCSLALPTINVSYFCNIGAMSAYRFQSVAAAAAIARLLPCARYALVFTANTFVGLGVCVLVNQWATRHEWTTDDFYWCAAAFQGALALGFGVWALAQSCGSVLRSSEQGTLAGHVQ